MRRVTAALVVSMAGFFASPASATTEYLIAFCERFLDRYEQAMAQFDDDSDLVHRARYEYYLHLRRHADRTVRFCEHLLDSHDGGTSHASQVQRYAYIYEDDD